jgi:hypothetical protein
MNSDFEKTSDDFPLSNLTTEEWDKIYRDYYGMTDKKVHDPE